ncbi:MAG: hypothetical protein ABSF51_08055 [Verrucomicrobiota bacterium]|jgi:hypothetical protein
MLQSWIRAWKKTAYGQRVRKWYNQFEWYKNYKLNRAANRRLTPNQRRAVKQLKLGTLSLRLRATQAEFLALQRQWGSDLSSSSRYLAPFKHGVFVDPPMIQIIKKFQTDFQLHNFVETGTFEGESSFAMTLLFDRVYTCDVRDWPRGLDFYCSANLTYETTTSPEFLRKHLPAIREHSLFFLDAHWGEYWPLLDELAIIFANCRNPVIIIDDFDAGNGLDYDAYKGRKLDLDYVASSIPAGYKFFVNSWSYRNRGMVFIFPGAVEYGCLFHDRANYEDAKHGLWNKFPPYLPQPAESNNPVLSAAG